MSLNPPTEHQLLVFWVGLLVILVAARLLGAVMQRIGQPAVIGELAAGLILGPSVLGKLAPAITDWLFPADDVQTGMLFTVGWLGVLFLLVSTGFETDLGLIGRLGRAAVIVSAGSLLVPAIAGFAVGWFLPMAFVGSDTERYIFALFVAAALSISSLPVIAKILGEMGLMRRNFGQLTLAAGMANDVIGWVALGLIAGLAQAGGLKLDKLAFTVVGLIVFFVVAFTVGQRVVDTALKRVRANGGDQLSGMTVVLVTTLSFGVVTQWLHVEAVLGAFIAGVILARSRFAEHELIRPLETMTAAVFAPIFFATASSVNPRSRRRRLTSSPKFDIIVPLTRGAAHPEPSGRPTAKVGRPHASQAAPRRDPSLTSPSVVTRGALLERASSLEAVPRSVRMVMQVKWTGPCCPSMFTFSYAIAALTDRPQLRQARFLLIRLGTLLITSYRTGAPTSDFRFGSGAGSPRPIPAASRSSSCIVSRASAIRSSTCSASLHRWKSLLFNQ